VGERAHVDPRSVTLETHLADLTGLLEGEELQEAVRVGHRSGGRSPARPRACHRRCVTSSMSTPIRAHGVLPPREPLGLRPDRRRCGRVARRQTPQPGRVYDAPLAFDARSPAGLGKTFVDCTDPPLAIIDASRRRVREPPDYAVIEIPSGPDPIVSAAPALVGVLDEMARTSRTRTA
jgi:hypothetical protein